MLAAQHAPEAVVVDDPRGDGDESGDGDATGPNLHACSPRARPGSVHRGAAACGFRGDEPGDV